MDKELLFKVRLEERELELPDVGTIRLRALTQDDVIEAQELHSDGDEIDHAAADREIIARAMVDPVLTPAEVARWAAAAPAGEMSAVLREIRDLSGLTEEAAKSGVRGNRQQRRAAVRNGSRRKAR